MPGTGAAMDSTLDFDELMMVTSCHDTSPPPHPHPQIANADHDDDDAADSEEYAECMGDVATEPRLKLPEPAAWPVQALRTELQALFNGQAAKPSTLTLSYASDCSGADAPGMALHSIYSELKKSGIIHETSCWSHLWACDIDKACFSFLRQNHAATTVFKDMVKREFIEDGDRRYMKGIDFSGNPVEVTVPPRGDLSMYSVGFECQAGIIF